MRKLMLLLSAVLMLGLSSPSWGLQLSELKSAVRLRLRDTTTDTNRQRFSDSDILTVLNEGQRQVVNQTWLLQDTTTFGLTSGWREYVMPSDFIKPLRVDISSRTLVEDQKDSLMMNKGDWSTATSTPSVYYIDYAINTSVVIGFWPKPSTTSVNSTTVLYAQRATDLAAETDVPFNGRLDLYQHHDLLVDYSVGTLWLINGVPELAKPYLELYGLKTKLLSDTLGRMPNFNPAFTGNRGPRQ